MTEAPPQRVKPPGKRLSIVLAVLVHVLLIALLVYGIRWQTRIDDVVEVDLVRQVPAPPPPAVQEEPPPTPNVEPKPVPKPEPKPEPTPPPKKPDIVLKEKEKVKPPPKPEPVKAPPEAKPRFDPFRDQLAQEEKQRTLANQIAEEERKLKQQKDAAAAAQAAAAHSKALASYSERIRAKIRGNIVLPPDIKGNPSALFKVVQLPSGEVMAVQLTRSSGHAGYDAAVERAILKSSPLPKPDDPTLFARELSLTFCPDPREDGRCG